MYTGGFVYVYVGICIATCRCVYVRVAKEYVSSCVRMCTHAHIYTYGGVHAHAHGIIFYMCEGVAICVCMCPYT